MAEPTITRRLLHVPRAILHSALVICVACALLLGCAQYGARPACPAKGGSPWVEVSSAHFRVVSDLPLGDTESVARELEQRFDALNQAIFVHTRAPAEPITVVLFEKASDFH